MLLATAPQRCKLWLHRISTEAAAGRGEEEEEEEVSVMIVKCRCKMKVNQSNELKTLRTASVSVLRSSFGLRKNQQQSEGETSSV